MWRRCGRRLHGARARDARGWASELTVGKVWRIVRLSLGGACIALGIVGLFLPFLQGILLLAVGLSLLSAESERARRYRDRLQDWLRRRTLLHRKRESADG